MFNISKQKTLQDPYIIFTSQFQKSSLLLEPDTAAPKALLTLQLGGQWF